jgi:hypothetical protein
MKWNRAVRLGVLCAIPAAAGVLSLLTLVSLNSGGAISLGSWDLLPIAAGYDRGAARLLSSSQGPSAEMRLDARGRTEAAISQYPYDTGAWLQLAYLDQQNHGRLTAEGVAALQRSYDLVAAEPDFGVWRVAFALENSQSLPQPLRKTVHEEVAVLWTVPRDRRNLLKLQREIRNPPGRLSLALWIYQLQFAAAK